MDLEPGCVAVLKRSDPATGQVGFFVGREGGNVRLLGGNQSDAVNVASLAADRVIGKRMAE